jgi:hypothetical protein
MSSTVRKSPTPSLYATPDVDSDELAGRLAEHLVAVALVRKAPDDPVPFSVWWRVTDALRASTEQPPTAAVEAVDVALAVLQGAIDGILLTPTDGVAVTPTDASAAGRALRHAQVLVARLVLGAAATSPTLLHVRLVRLRRALLAAAAVETREPVV